MASAIGPFGFAGGLNVKADPLTLGKDQMSGAQNVYVYYGTLTKLGGSSAINSAALNSGAAVTGVCDWQTVAQNRYMVVVCGNKIFQSLNLGSTFTDITGSTTITAGATNQHTFASLNNILAICGGGDTPLQWTGTGNATALAGSPPTGNLVTTANNFMFISGNTSTPSRVWWSNVADPGTWGSANFVDFRASDGDIVTAIVPLNYNLVIFKRRSTGILYTQTTVVSGGATLAPLTQINVGMGCAGSQAWDILPDGRIVVFGSDAHLRIFDGSVFEDISDQTPPSSNIQPNFDAMNIARIPYVCVRVYPAKNQIWVAVSTGSNTTNDSIYIYDYQLETWQCSVPDRAANVMTTSIDNRTSPKHPIVLISGNYGGFVYEHDTGSNNAENSDGHIDGYGTCSIQLVPEPRGFIPRSVLTVYQGQSTGQLQFGWGFNGFTEIAQTQTLSEAVIGSALDTQFVLDTSVLAGDNPIYKTVLITTYGTTYSLQVQFRNVYAGQPFQVFPFYVSSEVIS